MRELALFAGVGGGLLGGHLLGWKAVCAVEVEDYPRRVLLARQADGCLPHFPIWDDVCTFDGRPWKGRIDVISGGFPCQPFSGAAHGNNTARDFWPEMARIVRESTPPNVFAENVQRKPIERAAGDLYEAGYTCRFTMLPASCLGAPHPRNRWWLVAHTNTNRQPRLPEYVEVAESPSVPALDIWEKDYTEPMGVSNGIPSRLDRLRGLGNAQVPALAALAWRLLRGLDT